MHRYTNDPFPTYTYVPGRVPHPLSDDDGHGCPGPQPSETPRLNATADSGWDQLPVYGWAADLFNHGYYWESHEAWESLWHLQGRKGVPADFLKGLIKLAAAGVKAHEGNLAGVHRHAKRAHELLESVPGEWFGRLQLVDVRMGAQQIAGLASITPIEDPHQPARAFDLLLYLRD